MSALSISRNTGTVELDLDSLSLLLADATRIVASLEATAAGEMQVDVDLGRGRRFDAAKAEVNHSLLHLQTLLSTAAGEAGMQYWRLRGRPDARFDEVEG